MLDFDINKLMETRNKLENIKQLINQNDKDLYNYIDSFLEKESNQIFKNKYDVAILYPPRTTAIRITIITAIIIFFLLSILSILLFILN